MTEMLNMQKLLDAGKREYPNLSMDELMSFIQMGINMKKESTMKKVKKAKGGNVSSQMEMFEEGGLKDDGGTVDPISGNDVPPGSTQEEVRDDIPAQLSEGEFVFPADVVRYIGLQNLMQMRQQAKVGLKEMEDMGQMGNSEEATMADDMPFDINDIDMQDEEEYNSDREMAKGGVVYAATGFGGTVTNAPGLTMKKSSFDNTAARNPTPEYKAPPIPTAAPSGGFKYGTGNKTETTTSYDKLVGGVGADEYRTYVNDAGAEIQVPFKSGQMLTGYVLPEGYRPKSADKVETAKTQSTRVKTAKVDSGDGGPSGPTGGAVDPNGDPMSFSGFTSRDALDVNMKSIGKMQMGILGVPGIVSGLKAGFGKGIEVNQMTLGAITQTFRNAKNAANLKGRDINTLTDKERTDLNREIERAKMAVQEFGLGNLGNVSVDDVDKNINTIAGLYGVKGINTKTNVNRSLDRGRVVGQIAVAREKERQQLSKKLGFEVQQGFTPETALGIESLGRTQQQSMQKGLEAGVDTGKQTDTSKAAMDKYSASQKAGTGRGQDVNSTGAVGSSGNLGGATGAGYGASTGSTSGPTGSQTSGVDDAPGDNSSSSTSDADATGENDNQAKGGFSTKRKASGKLKKKYMKQGGLASRK